MSGRVLWGGLPAPVRAAVTSRIGPVAGAHDVPDGLNCQFAAVLDTAGSPVFAKGVRDGGDEGGQDWEAALAPYVLAIGPRLQARLVADGWDILLFDAVEGRHAELGPGSPDLPLLASLLAAGAALPAPATPLPAWADRWGAHATANELAALRGDALVHGDINPHNVLVGPDRAWLVDWATASTGPGWADTAEAALRLMGDGHSAEQAHAWAAGIPVWRHVSAEALGMWAEVNCRWLTARAGERGSRYSNAQQRAFADQVRLVAVR